MIIDTIPKQPKQAKPAKPTKMIVPKYGTITTDKPTEKRPNFELFKTKTNPKQPTQKGRILNNSKYQDRQV